MGTWGPGLYSNDISADLRPAISRIVRLPLSESELLDCLVSLEPVVAANPNDEDYSTFWLVVADQLAKHDVFNLAIRDRAINMISSGGDLEMMQRLGMSAVDLRKRARSLSTLREKLETQSTTSRTQDVFATPEEYIFDVGAVYAYPVCKGKPINPYVAASKHDLLFQWKADRFGLMLVTDRGRAFDCYAWYQLATAIGTVDELPDEETLKKKLKWQYAGTGTCSGRHFGKMQLTKFRQFNIQQRNLNSCFPQRCDGINTALQDVSIANRMAVYDSQIRQVCIDTSGDVQKETIPDAPTIAQLTSSSAGNILRNLFSGKRRS